MRDQEKYNQVTVKLDNKHINRLFNTLKNYNLKFISQVKHDLEKHFKDVLALQPESYVYKEEETRKDLRREKRKLHKEKKQIKQQSKNIEKEVKDV